MIDSFFGFLVEFTCPVQPLRCIQENASIRSWIRKLQSLVFIPKFRVFLFASIECLPSGRLPAVSEPLPIMS